MIFEKTAKILADYRDMDIAEITMETKFGVQLGTRFLVAQECSIHQNYKDKILHAKDIDTMTTGKRLGHPVRALKTNFSRELSKMEYNSSISNEEIETFGAGALRLAAVDGDEKNGCFMAGQIAAIVNKEQPAAEIISEMFSQAEAVLGGACKWIR